MTATTHTRQSLADTGIIELRKLASVDNPRNLSAWLINTMDREECEAYLCDGTLPSAEAKPGRASGLASGRFKFFKPSAEETAQPEPQASDEQSEEKPQPRKRSAAPAASGDLVEIIAQAVIDRLPPQEAQLDEKRVAAIASIAATKIIEERAAEPSAMDETLCKILTALTTAPAPAKARASVVLAKETGKSAHPIMDRLQTLCPVGANPGNHVLIIGPSGTGKTYQARIFANMHDWYTPAPIGLNKYVEPHHISGAAAPNDDGGFAFISGAFRDGFLAASQGKTACILLDELLRASAELQESLLTTLDPIPTAKGLVYRYRTGKPIKHGTNGSTSWSQEVIECPVEKLTIVATANVGTNYGVFSVDEAFYKRFRVIRAERNGADERQIIANAFDRFGHKAIKAAIVALDESRRLLKQGQLAYAGCIRTITRIGEQAANIKEVEREFEHLICGQYPGWTEDGAILPTHLDAAKMLFAKVKETLGA